MPDLVQSHRSYTHEVSPTWKMFHNHFWKPRVNVRWYVRNGKTWKPSFTELWIAISTSTTPDANNYMSDELPAENKHYNERPTRSSRFLVSAAGYFKNVGQMIFSEKSHTDGKWARKGTAGRKLFLVGGQGWTKRSHRVKGQLVASQQWINCQQPPTMD